MKYNQPFWKVVAQLAIAKSSSGGASPTLYHFYLQNKNLAVEAYRVSKKEPIKEYVRFLCKIAQ